MRNIYILLFTCIYLSAHGQKEQRSDSIIVVDIGVEIPITGCVESYGKILGNAVDPVAFCKCLIPKFYQYLKNDPEKLKILKKGNLGDLAKDKQEIIAGFLKNCIEQNATSDSTAKLTITPRIARLMKTKMKQELIGSDIEKTNDLDKYCDCIINSMQTDFTIKEIMQDNFNETKKYLKVSEKCLRSTRKKLK
jgi:hypothetical protein